MLARAFRTSSGRCYVYDGRTNRIITLKKVPRRDTWEQTEAAILELLREKGFLKDGPLEGIVWQKSFEEYLEAMNSGVPRLMLQITRRCNLNCSYCVYSGNYSHMLPHADADMPWQTLKESLDYFARRSRGCAKVGVDFYGGEALLRLDLLDRAVQYAGEVLTGRETEFHITSNGLLLNSRVRSWLAENPRVILTLTVNGPYHDEYRLTPDGHGSLEIILKNLEALRRENPAVWENQIRFLANIAHPSQLPPLKEFYTEKIGKPPVSITHIRSQHGNEVIREILDTGGGQDTLPRLQMQFCREEDPFLDAYFGSGLRALHTRPIFREEPEGIIGSCFPMVDRIFVHCDGRFGICESACDKVTLGDVENGPDIASLKKIYEGTERIFREKCSGCWAQRLCTVCLKDLYAPDGSMVTALPESFCKASREYGLYQLWMYCEIAETDPRRLARLKQTQDAPQDRIKNC